MSQVPKIKIGGTTSITLQLSQIPNHPSLETKAGIKGPGKFLLMIWPWDTFQLLRARSGRSFSLPWQYKLSGLQADSQWTPLPKRPPNWLSAKTHHCSLLWGTWVMVRKMTRTSRGSFQRWRKFQILSHCLTLWREPRSNCNLRGTQSSNRHGSIITNIPHHFGKGQAFILQQHQLAGGEMTP